MKHIFVILLMLCGSVAVQVQAQERERVFVHTDKNSYLAGESVWLKLYAADEAGAPSTLSKVGYVELASPARPWVQKMLALEAGEGSGVMQLPQDMPTGTYELTGYTRQMRNEGDRVFFRKQVTVINPYVASEADRYTMADSAEVYTPALLTQSDIRFKELHEIYYCRSLVEFKLAGLPEEVADLTLSVVREDSLTTAPEQPLHLVSMDKENWSGDWTPEYEGHIIPARVIGAGSADVKADVALVGRDVRFIPGQVFPDGRVNYYTEAIYGKQDMVVSARGSGSEQMYRVDLQSPYAETLPQTLPSLKIYPQARALQQRGLQVQLAELGRDTTAHRVDLMNYGRYYSYRPNLSYDLNEYTRFKTMRETFIEFVKRIIVRTMNGKPRIKVLKGESLIYNEGNTLVLLDGVPLYNHEDILNYNPMLVRRIDIYGGKYIFGTELYECMVQFTTHKGDLSGIQMDNTRQLLTYDFPSKPVAFVTPDYSDDETKASRRPDFRHTLYWNTEAEQTVARDNYFRFYTSDIPGRYRVRVEGFTRQGRPVCAEAYFVVR